MSAKPKVVPQAGRNFYLGPAVFRSRVLIFLNTSLRVRAYVRVCLEEGLSKAKLTKRSVKA